MAWEVGITPHATACGQKEQFPCPPVAHAHVSRNETGLYSAVIDHTIIENVSQFGFLSEISPTYWSPGISLQLRLTAAVNKMNLLSSFCPTSVNRTNPFSFSFVSSHEDHGVPIPVTEMA